MKFGKIQGPTNPGNIYNNLRNAGLSPTPISSIKETSNNCKCNNPEGPLAHQSRDYKKPEEDTTNQNEKLQAEEVRIIREMCKQAIFQARELMQTNLPEDKQEKLMQAIDPYDLSIAIKGFEALQNGPCPNKDTIEGFINHFKSSILLTIAKNLNNFYSDIVEKVKRNPSKPDDITWIK